jgi:PAB-dependent poly(A)-specific ribonuclease subunit 2
VHQRTAYLKLRLLADRGVTFVGHGLKTDFAVCNLFVPPAQVGDTLDLWALPRHRKLSLRLLAGCLLGSSIQVFGKQRRTWRREAASRVRAEAEQN